MTRKDFIIIAAALNETTKLIRLEPERLIREAQLISHRIAVANMCKHLRNSNSAFDAERFTTAAGF